MCAWIAGVVGALGSAYGASQSNKASKGAGQVDMNTWQDPWAPSQNYRLDLMERAYQAINGGTPSSSAGMGMKNLPPNGPLSDGAEAANPWPRGTLPGPGGGSGYNGRSGGGKGPRGTPVPGGGDGSGGGVGGGKNPDNGPADNGTQLYSSYVPAKGGKSAGKGAGKGGGKASTTGGGVRQPGGAAAGKKFDGTSQETDMIQQELIKQAQQGNPLYGVAENYTSQTLKGVDQNGYRSEAADMYRNMDDADLDRYISELWEGNMPGSKGGGSTGKGSGASAAGADDRKVNMNTVVGAYQNNAYMNGSSGGPGGMGMVGVQQDLRKILDGQGASKEVKDAISRRYKEEADKRLAGVMSTYVGSNMMGSTPWQQAVTGAENQSMQEMADSLAMADYELYGNALGLGTQYDIASQDRASQERAAAHAASSSSGAHIAEMNQRERLARMGALQDAIGMQMGQSDRRAGGMAAIGADFGSNQQGALGQVGNVTGLRSRDWGLAGDFSLGRDAGKNTYINNQNSRDVGMAGVNAQRFSANAALNWDKERYYREAPLSDLGRYADILNAASAGGGTTREYGTDKRSQSPSYTNVGAAAISGGMQGYTFGKDQGWGQKG